MEVSVLHSIAPLLNATDCEQKVAPTKNILTVWSHLPRSKRTQKLHFLAIRAWSSIIPKLNSKAMKLDDKGLLIPHLYTSFICMYIVRRLPSRQIFVFGYCRELLISTVSKSRRGETFHLLLIIKNRLTDCFGTKKNKRVKCPGKFSFRFTK